MTNNYLKKTIMIQIILAISILLSGCTSNINNLVNTKPNIKSEIKTQKLLSYSDIPQDITMSVNALILKMRGKTPKSKLVKFDTKGTHIVYEKNFKYDGFAWNNLNIIKHNIVSKTKDVVSVELVGIISFNDIIGRFTSSIFSMNYQIKNKKNITIMNSYIIDNFISKNMTKAYIVPLDKFKKKKEKLNDYASLFNFAKNNAIRMKANSTEIEEFNKLTFFDKLKGKYPNKVINGKFVMMVFCLERFPENINLILEVSNSEGVNPLYLNDNGWKMGMIMFEGEAKTIAKAFKLTVSTQKNKSSSKDTIAVFDNEMNYEKFSEELSLLSNGELLLNIKNKRDVQIIQLRLASLKYYNGKIDGNFGKGSMNALKLFNKDLLNIESNEWNINVQKALFKDSGL